MAIRISSGGETKEYNNVSELNNETKKDADSQNQEVDSAKLEDDEENIHNNSDVNEEEESEEEDDLSYLKDNEEEDDSDDEESEDEESNEEEKPRKTGVEKRITKLVKERNKIREENEQLRRLLLNNQQTTKKEEVIEEVKTLSKPKRDDFESYDDYTEALTDYKVKEEFAKIEKKKFDDELSIKTNEIINQWEKKVEVAKKRYKNWDDVQKANLQMTTFVRSEILEHEAGADVVMYLVNNPKKLEEINELSPGKQAREIVAIGDRLSIKFGYNNKTDKKHVKTSKAPEPLKPLEKSSVTSKKDASKMDFKEYRILALKQMKKL